MECKVNITTDDELQDFLNILYMFPDRSEIPYRMFCVVPELDYNAKIDPALGDGRKLMNTVYKNFAKDEDGVYVLIGESESTQNDDGTPSGGRDLVNDPINREELLAWIDKFGVESFHLDFPRPIVDELTEI